MNEGVIKFKSYSVAIGLLTPLMMLILGEYLFPWDSELSLGIADMFSIIALLFLKYGIAEESTLFKI
jgi:hypothetical protein